MPVVLRHPDIATLVPAASVYNAVTGGRWGAVADLCVDQLAAPDVTRADLDALATRTGWVFTGAGVSAVFDETDATLTLPDEAAVAVMDLFQRLLIGQWREIAYVAAWHARPASEPADLDEPHRRFVSPHDPLPGGRSVVEELALLRMRRQKPGGWPDHPAASWGIAQGPDAAGLAYHAWKRLGGGTEGAPTFSLQAPLEVART